MVYLFYVVIFVTKRDSSVPAVPFFAVRLTYFVVFQVARITSSTGVLNLSLGVTVNDAPNGIFKEKPPNSFVAFWCQ